MMAAARVAVAAAFGMIASTAGVAATLGQEDIIVTERGERVECQVVEMNSSESIKVRVGDGQVIAMPKSVVRSIELGGGIGEKTAEGEQGRGEEEDRSERKLVYHTGFSYAVGLELNGGGDCRYRGMNLQVLYRPWEGLSVGVGVMPSSMQSHSYRPMPYGYTERYFAMPIYGTFKFDFIRHKVSPFIVGRAGVMMADYTFGSTGNKMKSGFYFHASNGIRVALRRVALNPYMGVSYGDIKCIRRYDEDEGQYESGEFFSFGLMIEF